MNHRKEGHPSKKKCRYFAKGECNFSAEECWYIHGDTSNVDTDDIDDLNTFECFICKNMFSSKYDLMEQKKKHHPSKNLCLKFQKGTCERRAERCRYVHSRTITTTKATAKEPLVSTKPLPKMWKQDFLPSALIAPPDQGALVQALNFLNQRLAAMEEKIFPKLN